MLCEKVVYSWSQKCEFGMVLPLNLLLTFYNYGTVHFFDLGLIAVAPCEAIL